MDTTPVAEMVRARLGVRRALPPPEQRRALRGDMPQQELAEIVGVSQQAISHWEAGIRTPRGVFLERYVDALRALRELRDEVRAPA
ncbi:helix-turn-helix domain-containing protein [Streptomyces mirabilis]|uniref:helix-turn-helix domain-containing protein n=1 Tax=Streptomyces mirabilis TaxID=68239 RepID=UPI00363ED46C